jgi:hypothetical protein
LHCQAGSLPWPIIMEHLPLARYYHDLCCPDFVQNPAQFRRNVPHFVTQTCPRLCNSAAGLEVTGGRQPRQTGSRLVAAVLLDMQVAPADECCLQGPVRLHYQLLYTTQRRSLNRRRAVPDRMGHSGFPMRKG